MVALLPRALRLINAAIDLHASSADRERWLSWTDTHPGIRHREGGQRDVREPRALPEDIAVIIMGALRRRRDQLQNELEGVPDWDEFKISELDNEISYVRSVAAFIEDVPRKPRRDGAFRHGVAGR